MNFLGQPLKLNFDKKKLGILAVIGLILFIVLRLFPTTSSDTLEQSITDLITKEEAVQSARQFAEKELGAQLAGNDAELVTYQTNSDLYGYLSKEGLVGEYNKQFEKTYPYDVFRVRLLDEFGRHLNVDVHMTTGDIAAFKWESSYADYATLYAASDTATRNEKLRIMEGELSLDEKQALAQPWLERLGYSLNQLNVLTQPNEPGLKVANAEQTIGSASLQLSFSFEDDSLIGYDTTFSIPDAHTKYVNKQELYGILMTFIGYGLLSFVLGILAIVYSAKTRTHTSFKRGLFLSIFYFIASMISVFNMKPYFDAEGLDSFAFIFAIIVQGIVTLFMTALLYFSLVGGNGLWRKENGLNPWPRAKEPGYGRYVLDSMSAGYLWAFILLGVQSIIYVVLEKTMGTWSTTDASQSTYNMIYPWLMPIMAWMAGISEEAVYRLFGIKMLKKMVKSTFVASLITSLIWAFGHTLYPIYPVMTRPVELVIIGLLFSFIFLRYGFLTAMFSHVVFNSILMGISLVFMMDAVNVAAGIISIILPAIVAYIIYLFNPVKKEKPYITTPPAPPAPPTYPSHPEGQL